MSLYIALALASRKYYALTMRKKPIVFTKPINMRVSSELLRFVEARARAEKVTVSAWIRALIEDKQKLALSQGGR